MQRGESVMFQHTAARRRLGKLCTYAYTCLQFQHTAARRRLAAVTGVMLGVMCFNTQPPEGGWKPDPDPNPNPDGFNTQPPEGGW